MSDPNPFGPVTFDETIEIQAICTGPGGTTYSESVFITPGCATCAIVTQPVNVSGQVGSAINFGATATGPVIWQTATASTGPWTTATPPTSISAANDGTWWRMCCTDDPTVCSTAASITVTVAACQIVTQPVNVSGDLGDPVTLGGTATGPVIWQTAVASTGPWSNTTGPPTSITTANDGTWWRFCCTDNPTICSNPVSVMVTPDGLPLADTIIPLPDQGTVTRVFCAPCPADWEIRILNPDDQFNTPNNDPGLPEPADDAWQTVGEVSGLTCVELAINEEWADGLNPDTHGNPTEEFFLYIRALCGGVPTEAVLTIQV